LPFQGDLGCVSGCSTFRPLSSSFWSNGSSLARSEILLVISTLLRRLNFELYETTVEDVRVVHDIFIPFVKMDSKGVRFLIK
jgi:hypothetical protein